MDTTQKSEEKKLGPLHSEDFSKFGHSSEFRMFSLEYIETLVLNLRPVSVYYKSSFRYGPSFSSLRKQYIFDTFLGAIFGANFAIFTQSVGTKQA